MWLANWRAVLLLLFRFFDFWLAAGPFFLFLVLERTDGSCGDWDPGDCRARTRAIDRVVAVALAAAVNLRLRRSARVDPDPDASPS